MIRTLAITPSYEAVIGLPLEEIRMEDYIWIWVDFSEPTPEEARMLDSYFHFHPLAVEDCMHPARPKLDYYEQMQFLVLHALQPDTLGVVEVDLFLAPSYIVSFHEKAMREMDEAWDRVLSVAGKGPLGQDGPSFTAYTIMDKLVDQYFQACLPSRMSWPSWKAMGKRIRSRIL